jgi:DMSO reductase family type II enzyme chaperone
MLDSAASAGPSPGCGVVAASVMRGALAVALCRSAVWEALALALRPPTAETITRLATAEEAAALADAAAALDPAGDGGLVARVRALARDPLPLCGVLADLYWRMFGHTVRGAVPPYETEYGEDSVFGPPREMADLSAFYRAFGLGVRPDAHERPDHIACECELMLVVARKEALALEREDAAALEVVGAAGRAFLREHLGRWAPAFGRRLAREDPGGFYGAVGDLCATFVAAECRRLGVPAGPELVRLRSPDLGSAPMACGPAAAGCGPPSRGATTGAWRG